MLQKDFLTKSKFRENEIFIRFIFIFSIQGLSNYLTYLVVLQVHHWLIAFFAGLVVGLLIQTPLQIKKTFGRQFTRTRALRYIAYQGSYVVAFALCMALIIRLGMAEEFAPLLVILVLAPINFVVSRRVINGPPETATDVVNMSAPE